MVSVLCVIQTFEAAVDEANTPFVGDEGIELRKLIVSSDFKRFLVLNATELPPLLSLTNGSERIRGWITTAANEALGKHTQENRLVRQELVIMCASAREVRYEHRGKEYAAWFVGRLFQVHAPENPITDVLLGMVAESVKLWKEDDKEDAARQLREVLDMTKADEACRMNYLLVRDTIPDALISKAKWFRWKPFIVAGLCAIVILLVFGLIILAVKLSRE